MIMLNDFSARGKHRSSHRIYTVQLSLRLEGKQTFGSSNKSLKIGALRKYAKSLKYTCK